MKLMAHMGFKMGDNMSKKAVPNDSEKQINKVKNFTWSENKLNVAKSISDGTKTQLQIAEEFNITNVTISRWKQHSDFMEKVDEFTLMHENATKAGLLREAYKGLNIKSKNISNDKSSHLDYVKAIADIQGHSKQTILHEGAPVNVLFYLPDNKRDIKIVNDVEDDGTTDNSN